MKIPANKNIWILATVFLWLSGLTGCANLGTYNPATGRREFIFVPTDMELDMGKEVHPQIIKQYPLSGAQTEVSRLQRIGQSLSQVSDRQDYEYQFYLLEAKEINAFTVPGGRVYMFDKLMASLKTDDEVAAVVAHEIGHCAARHTIKKFQAAMGYDLLANIIFSQVKMSDFVKQVASLSSNTLMSLIFSSYGREDEYEADRLGLKYMHLAGYDLQGMIKVFAFLEKESKDPKIPLILRTHPYVSDRIIAARKEIERIQAEGRKSDAVNPN